VLSAATVSARSLSLGSDDEPFRKAKALSDLDTFLAGLGEEFMVELAAEPMQRVWDKETRDPQQEIVSCSSLQIRISCDSSERS
jgi:hypothetical protein